MTYTFENNKFYKTELIKKEISPENILIALELLNERGREVKTDKLELEMTNFKIDSSKWKKKKGIKTNPEWDVFEDEYWEQFFTWEWAMRETKKAWKRMPTDEEFDEIIWDMDRDEFMKKYNIEYAGYRNSGIFLNRGNYAFLWSSTEYDTTNARGRGLGRNNAWVCRVYRDKSTFGFSCRTILEK